MTAIETGAPSRDDARRQRGSTTPTNHKFIKKLEGHATKILVAVSALSVFLLWVGFASNAGGSHSFVSDWLLTALAAGAHVIALALSAGAAVLIFKYGMIYAFGDQQSEQSPNLRTLL